ncbi:MAG: M42 family metallopeptidase [Oscillochloris sp.]|nr:M42 family metallopeptidase [Oscillochloris sp.]
MKEALIETLGELTALHAPPGFEQPVVRYLRAAFAPLADEVQVDSLGNLYAIKHGPSGGPRLMISAHSDEIGGIVKSILPSGFLKIDRLGGVLDSLALGRKVWVNGHLGVVGAKSGHLQSLGERGQVQPMDTLYVDVGADSADEVANMGISIGDPWVWLSELEPMTNPDRLVGKAIDNRISCAILLQLFQELHRTPLAGTLIGVVTVQEEVGLRGARVAAQRAAPDYAVVVDTFMSGDTPDVNYHSEMPTRIGGGPVALLANSGHLAHRGVMQILSDAAARADVKLQPATVLGKSSTDAAAIHLAREGIPTGGLGICRRYSHAPVELLDINDAVASVRVLEEVCRSMDTAMATIAAIWA